MRFVRLLAILAFAAAGASAQQDQDVPDELESKRFIIEFTSGTHAKAKRDELLASREGIAVVNTFDSPLFSGASVETDTHNLDSLLSLPDVVRVWPNSKAHLVAPVGRRQVAVDPDAAAEHAVHWATGVDKLHEQGILGSGVKVGVVDTGIWYTHAALGGGFGDGFKVAGGWDLVGDAWVAGGAKAPDDDPLDQQGHGTHVAGIIAGASDFAAAGRGWRGVAPECSLYAYKVFGPGDGTDTATIIDAFLRAYDDGMDVIHASIGGRGGFAENAWAVVASRIAAEGVVVTISAGNSGNGGAYYASSGSSGENVIAVASAEVKRSASGDVIRPSYFTSWGGLYDLSVKPDIAAPGTDVFSAWPGEDNNQFVLLSGTSMAGPYVAGVAALYISKHGGRSIHGKGFARDLAMRIISSGSSLPWLLYGDGGSDPSFRAPSQHVGGGLIDAAKVLGYRTSLELARFGLNDTANFRSGQAVTIRNEGNETVRYTFELESWAGFDMLRPFDGKDPGETPRIRYRPEMVPSNVTVRAAAAPKEVELLPGEARKAEFVFEAPPGFNETALPAYGGRVVVKGSNGETVGVPFQGLAFDLKEQMQSAFHGTYPWLRSTSAYSNKTTFNLNLASGSQDFPMMFMKIKWGTREVRWDIYEQSFDDERDWEYPPVPGRNGYIGSATSWSRAGSVSSFNPARHDASDTFSFPVTDQGRNALTTGGFTTAYYWFGKMADGSRITPGNYTMRFAVLVPFADPKDASSWKGLTTDFTILLGNGTVRSRIY